MKLRGLAVRFCPQAPVTQEVLKEVLERF